MTCRILWCMKRVVSYFNILGSTRIIKFSSEYNRIVITNIRNLSMSLEFILAICWRGLTFIFLEVNSRLFVKNATFTIADEDDFGFYNLCHCPLCCATNYTISLRAQWRTGTTHADSLSEVVVNTMYAVAMVIGSENSWALTFSKQREVYLNPILSRSDYND